MTQNWLFPRKNPLPSSPWHCRRWDFESQLWNKQNKTQSIFLHVLAQPTMSPKQTQNQTLHMLINNGKMLHRRKNSVLKRLSTILLGLAFPYTSPEQRRPWERIPQHTSSILSLLDFWKARESGCPHSATECVWHHVTIFHRPMTSLFCSWLELGWPRQRQGDTIPCLCLFWLMMSLWGVQHHLSSSIKAHSWAVQVSSLHHCCQETGLSLINIYLTNSRDGPICLEESCAHQGEWLGKNFSVCPFSRTFVSQASPWGGGGRWMCFLFWILPKTSRKCLGVSARWTVVFIRVEGSRCVFSFEEHFRVWFFSAHLCASVQVTH